jgi:hypothetical protein
VRTTAERPPRTADFEHLLQSEPSSLFIRDTLFAFAHIQVGGREPVVDAIFPPKDDTVDGGSEAR